MLIASASNIPPVTVAEVSFTFFSALFLVMMRETVIGIPEEAAVINSPSTEREI